MSVGPANRLAEGLRPVRGWTGSERPLAPTVSGPNGRRLLGSLLRHFGVKAAGKRGLVLGLKHEASMVPWDGAPGSDRVLAAPGLLAGWHLGSGAPAHTGSPPGGARNAASRPDMRRGGVGAHPVPRQRCAEPPP